MITIKGTVGTSGQQPVTGIPINTHIHAVLKIAFENHTSGTNLGLYASGSDGEQRLTSSGGPGFQSLIIIDTVTLAGKNMFVRRDVGSADSHFTLMVE